MTEDRDAQSDFDRWLTSGDDLKVSEILRLLEERKSRQSRKFYAPLDPRRRRVIREFYRRGLPSWAKDGFDGGVAELENRSGTRVTRGWARVVIGDYGAFVEMSRVQVDLLNLHGGGAGNAYNWLRTRDASRTKVYEQLRGVTYADYRPGMFYVAPADVAPFWSAK